MLSHAVAGVVAAVLSVPLPSLAADPSPQGVGTYVSDEFKTVAVRLLRQFAAAEIQSACKSDNPICNAVVRALGDAFSAAVAHDQAGLQKTLSTFFLSSSSNALLQVSAGDLLDKAGSDVPADALKPLLRCLSAAVSGQSLRTACSLSAAEKDALTAQAQKLASDCNAADKPACDQFVAALAGKKLDPSKLVVVLAVHVEDARPDLAIYLRRVAAFLAEGVDQGLWPPARAFVLKEDQPGSAVQRLLAFSESQPGYVLWTPKAKCNPNGFAAGGTTVCDEVFANALKSCGAGAAAAWDAWVKARDDGFVVKMRSHFVRSEPYDLGPLQALLDVSCAAPPVKQLQRYVRFSMAPLVAYRAIRRASVAGLAIAALLDYLRNRDEVALNAKLRWALLYGLGEVIAQERNAASLQAEEMGGARVTKENWMKPQDALDATCEGRAASALLGFPPAVAANCFSLAGGHSVSAEQWTQAPAGGPTKEWLAANGPSMLAVVEPGMEKALHRVESAGWLTEVDATTLQHALQQWAGGQLVEARQLVLRLGIDLMVDSVDKLAERMLDNDEAKCTISLRTTTIFSGIGTGCAVHLLILGAYRPIADYYWQTGIGAENVSEVATSVYTHLLQSPALASTPIILNVGLGGNYIVGHKAVWGNSGYAAATVVDKFGLAFFKFTSERWRLETGPFAGGFLDALIRTAASEGKDERYWLLGYTLGFTRMWGSDVGVELHLGAAMPFTFSATDHYGFAAGAALVVPFDLVFDKGD